MLEEWVRLGAMSIVLSVSVVVFWSSYGGYIMVARVASEEGRKEWIG
jgi:hypothetical protein